jgi:hypothetical protein
MESHAVVSGKKIFEIVRSRASEVNLLGIYFIRSET